MAISLIFRNYQPANGAQCAPYAASAMAAFMAGRGRPPYQLLKRTLLLNDVLSHFGFEILQHALDGLRGPGAKAQ